MENSNSGITYRCALNKSHRWKIYRAISTTVIVTVITFQKYIFIFKRENNKINNMCLSKLLLFIAIMPDNNTIT